MGFSCWGEFTRGKLSLDHPEKDRFDRSQWCPPGRVSTWYMMYRVFVAIMFVSFVICHIIAFPIPEKWIIFMTDQGVLFLTLHFVLYAALVLTRWIQERRSGLRENTVESLPLIYRISWAMGSCFSNAALVITLIYWIALHRCGTGFCNEDGCVNYIYPILDWSGNPGIAVLTVVLALIVIPLGQCVWFGLYKLRLWIFNRVTSS
ncbi:uncharacterized protein LOC131876820 isoform X2 [Tigriopus californicus]|uniref:uncharacterized protein LOC131876820 isoform X2 n=1 Tax=Tigriopus californicus TaxID=6832 RepID=UPI0027DA0E8A|nr:uncharacterized protein LOC131876820 isoform X2 [Tigriopus californicus]